MSTAPGPARGGRQPSGDEAATARSPLTLRLVLATAGLLLWLVVAVALLATSAPLWGTAVAAALAVASAADLAVVARRKRRGEPG